MVLSWREVLADIILSVVTRYLSCFLNLPPLPSCLEWARQRVRVDECCEWVKAPWCVVDERVYWWSPAGIFP